MQLHPRFTITQRAEIEFQGLTADWLEKHDLTYLEAMRIMHARLQQLTTMAVRVERHGDDSDKGADEA